MHLRSFPNTKMAQVDKSFLVGDNKPFIPNAQYFGYRWRGDVRDQGISSHDTDPVILEYSGFGIIRFS